VGLGYVGAVSAACLSNAGHDIWGVDVNAEKLANAELIIVGHHFEGLDRLLAQTSASVLDLARSTMQMRSEAKTSVPAL